MIEEEAISEIDGDETAAIEPKSAQLWLDRIANAEKALDDYQRRADNIDKLYADLKRLSEDTRDRQFQLFWANIQVLGPSVYARTPVPVVVPKFKDRRPLYRVSSELLERCAVVSFDIADINSVMLLLRDDLNIVGRSAAWVRYETKAEGEYETEKVCYDFKDRKDFLHEPARNWNEVGWVAAASYMAEDELKARFGSDATAEYKVQKDDRDNGAADNRSKAKVWEIWSKEDKRVYWVAEGGKEILEEDKPHLKLQGFFPCPKPAYATVQRRSLIPVPDFVYYKDQIEEINQLTNRIHALADAIKVRGFYPAGAAEIGDAVEAAIKSLDDRQVLVPISNWAAFGTTSGDPIIWLPIEVIANTVAGLVELRRQVIDDVYQIMGLSDIMRGSTEKEETLGAQELKAQFGSVRIRDKQGELVRIARDMVRIAAEIMAENFSPQTMLEMSQLEIPTDADIAQQAEQITGQADQTYQQAMQQAQQAVQQQPQAAQQVQQQLDQYRQQLVQQTSEQIRKLQEQPTIEKVMAFLRNNKIRPFVLDIETDSTIAPDEQAEKAARTEFVAALGGMLQQFGPMIQMVPQAAPVLGEVLKFALAPFRAGRELEGKIDEAVDQMAAQAQQPQPNPEAEAIQAEMAMKKQEMEQKAKIEKEKIAADREDRQAEQQMKREEHQFRMAELKAEMQRDQQKFDLEMQMKQQDLQLKRETAEIQANALQQKANIQVQGAQQQADIAAQRAEQQAEHSEMAFQQKSELTAQQAAAKQANGVS